MDAARTSGRVRRGSSLNQTILYSIACVFLLILYINYRLHIHYLQHPLHDDEERTFHDLLLGLEESFDETFISKHGKKLGISKIDESKVFTDIMERVIVNQEQCRIKYNEVQNISSKATDVSDFTATGAIKASFDALNHTNEAKDQKLHEICYLPPKQTCANEFTTIVTYAPTKPTHTSHRTLFVNLLSILNRRNVTPDKVKIGNENILLLYYAPLDDLKKDKDYGRRIWNWHEENKIILINGTKNDSNLLHQFHHDLLDHVNNDIILYLDGSMQLTQGIAHEGTGGIDSLEAGFELIQQNSQLLVGSQVYEYSGTNSTSSMDSWGTLPKFNPACASTSSIGGTMQDSIIHYSGMFLHKNYLCFIWHNLFAELRETLNSISRRYQQGDHSIHSELISIFISSMVPQLSGNTPALYPLMKPSWSIEEEEPYQSRRLIDEVVSNDNERINHANLHRRRRTKWITTNSEESEHTPLTRSEFQPGRRLSSLENISTKVPEKLSLRSQLKVSEVSSIISFFGSHSKGSLCWCNEQEYEKNSNFTSQLLCKDKCPNGGSISKDQLPWLAKRIQCNLEIDRHKIN